MGAVGRMVSGGGGRPGYCHQRHSHPQAGYGAIGGLGSRWLLSPLALGYTQVETRTTNTRAEGDVLSPTRCLLPMLTPLPPTHTKPHSPGSCSYSPATAKREKDFTASPI